MRDQNVPYFSVWLYTTTCPVCKEPYAEMEADKPVRPQMMTLPYQKGEESVRCRFCKKRYRLVPMDRERTLQMARQHARRRGGYLVLPQEVSRTPIR